MTFLRLLVIGCGEQDPSLDPILHPVPTVRPRMLDRDRRGISRQPTKESLAGFDAAQPINAFRAF